MPKPLWQMMTGLPTFVPVGETGYIEVPTKSGPVRLPTPGNQEFFVRQVRLLLDLQVKDVEHPASA